MGRKEKRAARKTALLGVLFALAAVLSLVEGALAPALGLPPGVKPVSYTHLFIRRTGRGAGTGPRPYALGRGICRICADSQRVRSLAADGIPAQRKKVKERWPCGTISSW